VNTRRFVLACLSLVLVTKASWAQDAATHTVIDIAGIKKFLGELDYEPVVGKSGDAEYLQIDLKHSNGETRKHLVGIDPQAKTIFILGGGFTSAPDPKKGTSEWYRRLAATNHKIAPNYIFINDFDVFGLTTVIGNVDITAERLKTKLKDHITSFDDNLVPLVKELPPMEKKE